MFLSMTKNRPDVVMGSSIAARSYNIARLRTIYPRWSTISQTSPIAGGVRCLNARCDNSLRYIKLNARPSHNVVRGRTTIAHDIYKKTVLCISLIFSGENMSKCRMNSYDVVRWYGNHSLHSRESQPGFWTWPTHQDVIRGLPLRGVV